MARLSNLDWLPNNSSDILRIMNKADTLFDTLNSFYGNMPKARSGYLETIIRQFEREYKSAEITLQEHIDNIKDCERRFAAYKELDTH
jgi:hypothetical protein